MSITPIESEDRHREREAETSGRAGVVGRLRSTFGRLRTLLGRVVDRLRSPRPNRESDRDSAPALEVATERSDTGTYSGPPRLESERQRVETVRIETGRPDGERDDGESAERITLYNPDHDDEYVTSDTWHRIRR